MPSATMLTSSSWADTGSRRIFRFRSDSSDIDFSKVLYPMKLTVIIFCPGGSEMLKNPYRLDAAPLPSSLQYTEAPIRVSPVSASFT